MGRLHTTRAETAQVLKYALSLSDLPHFAIETYTWPIIARRRNAQELINGIVREFQWVLGEMGAL